MDHPMGLQVGLRVRVTRGGRQKILNKWIIDSLRGANPRLWYGGEGQNFDPRAQTEDLGDKPA